MFISKWFADDCKIAPRKLREDPTAIFPGQESSGSSALQLARFTSRQIRGQALVRNRIRAKAVNRSNSGQPLDSVGYVCTHHRITVSAGGGRRT